VYKGLQEAIPGRNEPGKPHGICLIEKFITGLSGFVVSTTMNMYQWLRRFLWD
jgi:molybdopterin biosynthesis enzyme